MHLNSFFKSLDWWWYIIHRNDIIKQWSPQRG